MGKTFDSIPWRALQCHKKQLTLDIVLKCGQSFRWTKSKEFWIGVLFGRVWQLSQDDHHLHFRSLAKEELAASAEEKLLRDYFQLDVDLVPLYEKWAANDPVFEKLSTQFAGVRMLRQDPVENLFSFICSSNNNIQRISQMVENMCSNYGQEVASIDNKSYYAFPTIDRLAEAEVEAKLRKLGFGYRAAYISKTARQLQEKGGKDFLMSLRSNYDYEEARQALLTFNGIGPKVADCILLMSLDKPGAIPVDTHMFQIAAKSYLPHLKAYKSVTDKVYVEIGQHFRSLYGEYAGWAHSVLFSADLKHLQEQHKEASPTEKKKARKRKSSQR